MRYGIALAVIGIAAVTAFSILHNTGGSAEVAGTAAVATTTSAPAASSSSVTLMQSTGVAFSSSPDYQYAYEVYPTLASGATKALGAFSVTKTALSGGAYDIALTNGTAGFQGQHVTVGPGQSVYFIERTTHDDSGGKDIFPGDDLLVAVDAQGDILK